MNARKGTYHVGEVGGAVAQKRLKILQERGSDGCFSQEGPGGVELVDVVIEVLCKNVECHMILLRVTARNPTGHDVKLFNEMSRFCSTLSTVDKGVQIEARRRSECHGIPGMY